MGVVTFRTPHEGIEQYHKAVDIISLIQEIVRNPKVGETVKDLSEKLLRTHELSEEKKHELFQADEMIAQAKEAKEDLEKDRLAHEKKANSDFAELENKRIQLTQETKLFYDDKINTKKLHEKIKLEAEEKFAQAKKLHEEAGNRHALAEKLEKAVFEKEKTYQANVEKLEKDRADAQIELDSLHTSHAENVRKLLEEKAIFDIRKKKFDALLKEE